MKLSPCSRYENIAPYTAMLRSTSDKRLRRLPTRVEPYDQHDGESEQAAGNERNVRCLVLAMSKREEMREVAGPRQRKNLSAIGEDDCMEARNQSGDGEQCQHLRGA